MSKLKKLEDFREEIEQCVKCGACRAHCPVFGAEKHEGRVARGKVALAHSLLEGQVDLEAKVLEDMSQCLLCGSCCAQCPNKVPTDDIVVAARRRIAEERGLSSFGKGVAAVLGRPKLMNTLAKTGGALSSLLFKKLPENSGLRLRFPAPYLDRDRTLPPIAAKPFREQHPEIIHGKEGAPTVAFFTGCGINYMYPQIGEVFLKTLKFLGVTIVIPKDQACCGLPAVSAGAGKVVEQIYGEMGGDFEKLAAKTKDIFVFLVEQGFPEKLAALPKTAQRTRVTYHDPCHLRTRGITKEPRLILKALPQVDFVEMTGAGTCCGLGGTYSVYHYDTSKKIGAKKAANIEASGAELVATDCPGCIMQLQDSLNHAGQHQKAVHLLELVDEALSLYPDSQGS